MKTMTKTMMMIVAAVTRMMASKSLLTMSTYMDERGSNRQSVAKPLAVTDYTNHMGGGGATSQIRSAVTTRSASPQRNGRRTYFFG